MNIENRYYCLHIAESIESAYRAGEECYESEELLNWLDEHVLDTQFITDVQKSIRDVRLYVTLGGPTVWIDTELKSVQLRWGTESAEYGLDWDLCSALVELYSECY